MEDDERENANERARREDRPAVWMPLRPQPPRSLPEAPANGRTPEHGHPEGYETYGHWKEPYTEQRVEYPLSRLPHAIKDLPDRVHELSWTHEVKETRGWQPVTVAMVGPHC